MMPRYDCDEEVDPGKPDTSDEDDFFN